MQHVRPCMASFWCINQCGRETYSWQAAHTQCCHCTTASTACFGCIRWRRDDGSVWHNSKWLFFISFLVNLHTIHTYIAHVCFGRADRTPMIRWQSLVLQREGGIKRKAGMPRRSQYVVSYLALADGEKREIMIKKNHSEVFISRFAHALFRRKHTIIFVLTIGMAAFGFSVMGMML